MDNTLTSKRHFNKPNIPRASAVMLEVIRPMKDIYKTRLKPVTSLRLGGAMLDMLVYQS